MAKKKHRKKARSAKHAGHHKSAERPPHAKRAKRSKRSKHRGVHAKPEHHSSEFLRAVKRRRAAERGEHVQASGTRPPGSHAHKRVHHSAHKRGHHHAEPVVTEKSFENMLAYRRFQNHAR